MGQDEPREREVPRGTLLGRYRLGPPIGRGGMATVYVARDTLLGRDVAIKFFAATAGTPAELRVQEAEAKLVAGLNHYALTTLFDAGVDASDPDDPHIYLVMEYIAGIDLKERLELGPLEAEQVAHLGFDLAEALDYVHENGFLHRDVKPANVLLATRGATKRLRGKLTDFGISSIIGAVESGEYTVGTAAYLSPEQVEGDDPGPASDVYALGLVLLEALTARVSYPGSVEDSAYARLDRDPEVPDGLPRRTRHVLRAMTARRAGDRPRLVEVASAFQDQVIDEVVGRRRLDPALLAADETARLTALRRFDILDTPPEREFDQVTRIASRLLGMPVALITLTDVDRVWVKSRYGTDVQQVGRGDSICASTNPGTAPWSIPDTWRDARTAASPFVTGEPWVRSYAGAPLVTGDGHVLGALCVYGYEPRHFGQADLADLADLAGIVMRELDRRLATRPAAYSA